MWQHGDRFALQNSRLIRILITSVWVSFSGFNSCPLPSWGWRSSSRIGVAKTLNRHFQGFPLPNRLMEMGQNVFQIKLLFGVS